jgi:hypothetical protein
MIASTDVPHYFDDQAAHLRALQPVYSALVREFVIEIAACPLDRERDDPNASPSPESLEQATVWFQKVDARLQVHQLRQFLQTTPLASEAVLRNLLWHHMQKTAKSPSDRDKTDFLLVQYYSLCAPSGVEDSDIDVRSVADVLEPVLGPQPVELPAWLNSLDAIAQSAGRCRRLSELLHGGTLEQGRKLKTANAARYFEPPAMIAFARFSFLIRRIFFRLMHEDLNAIQDGLRELERRNIPTVDCRRAQFSADEPVSRLRMICQSWKVMFHAEYSSGQPLRMLVDLRAAVDDALQSGARKPLAARAASASGKSSGGAQE